MLLDEGAPRGKKAEDLVDDLLAADSDVGDDIRWDIRVYPQHQLVGVTPAFATYEESESDAQD